MASLPTSPLTEEQYLSIERMAESKSEFHDGQMFAMSGGTMNHSLLSLRICLILDRGVPATCRTLNADMRIKVAAAGLYTYPDCSVICGQPELFADDVLLNPLLIAEVLSPSTENYDRGKKFELYRMMKTFCEYLLIHQDRRHVEYYSKQDDGSWVLREYSGADSVITITRLNLKITLSELYASALNLS